MLFQNKNSQEDICQRLLFLGHTIVLNDYTFCLNLFLNNMGSLQTDIGYYLKCDPFSSEGVCNLQCASMLPPLHPRFHHIPDIEFQEMQEDGGKGASLMSKCLAIAKSRPMIIHSFSVIINKKI